VSIDGAGRIRTANSAAVRLLGIDPGVAGLPAATVFGGPELHPLGTLVEEASRTREDTRPQDVTVTCEGRELHLSVMITPLRRDDGGSEGLVIVFDDVTPLVRAQKVAAWREVARRLAHEVKNPLTPIQLCAERMRRHFSAAPSATRQLVEECTSTIVGEVASLKDLVTSLPVRADARAARCADRLARAAGQRPRPLPRHFHDLEIRPRLRISPKVSVDPEQIAR